MDQVNYDVHPNLREIVNHNLLVNSNADMKGSIKSGVKNVFWLVLFAHGVGPGEIQTNYERGLLGCATGSDVEVYTGMIRPLANFCYKHMNPSVLRHPLGETRDELDKFLTRSGDGPIRNLKQKAQKWGVWSMEYIYPMIKFDITGTQTTQQGVTPMTHATKHFVKGIYFPLYRLLKKLIGDFPNPSDKMYITDEQKAILDDKQDIADKATGGVIKSMVHQYNCVDVVLAQDNGTGVHQSDLSGEELSSSEKEDDDDI